MPSSLPKNYVLISGIRIKFVLTLLLTYWDKAISFQRSSHIWILHNRYVGVTLKHQSSRLSLNVPKNDQVSELARNEAVGTSYGRTRTQDTNNFLLRQSNANLPLYKSLLSSGSYVKEIPMTSNTYLILTMLFLVTTICSLVRVAMSVAIIPMGSEFGYTNEIKGSVSSSFSFGYLFGMIPAGILGSFFPPKAVMTTGVLLWSIAQCFTPYAANLSLEALLLTRFFLGISESVAIPTVQNFVSRLVSEDRKSLYLGIILSGLQAGNVAAFLLSPYILDRLEWSGLLVAYGTIGLLWVLIWVPFVKNEDPLKLKSLVPTAVFSTDAISDMLPSAAIKETRGEDSFSRAEKPVADVSLIESVDIPNPPQLSSSSVVSEALAEPLLNIPDNPRTILKAFQDQLESFETELGQVPFRYMISTKEVQAIAVAHAVQNVGLYINLAWLPTFFNQKYQLSVDDSSLSSVLPWLVGMIVGPLSGYLADVFLAQGVPLTLIRKVAQSMALIVPAGALVTLSLAGPDLTSSQAIAFFVVAIASAACCVAGFGSSVQDICASSKYVSIVYSLTSAPAVLLGSFGVYLTGVVLETTDSFSLVFQGTAVVYLLGALFYTLNYEAKKVIE